MRLDEKGIERLRDDLTDWLTKYLREANRRERSMRVSFTVEYDSPESGANDLGFRNELLEWLMMREGVWQVSDLEVAPP